MGGRGLEEVGEWGQILGARSHFLSFLYGLSLYFLSNIRQKFSLHHTSLHHDALLKEP